ncbi:MAG: hypothetical protein FWG83_00645 [Oscillospiraceae bacterium]|nr:hypothetical protein [Oscillospiraceae bacterium]
MRKIIFIALAVIVVAVAAIFCVREFTVPRINFVADEVGIVASANTLRVSRLYAAEVDFDAYEQALDEIIDITEYTDEERFAAALASGRPEFYPVFGMHVLNDSDNELRVMCFVLEEMATGQKGKRFKIGEISLETMITGGDFTIDRLEIVPFVDTKAPFEITKINSAHQAALDISNAGTASLVLGGDWLERLRNGEECSFTLRFIYNIKSDTFLPRIVLDEQLLQVNGVISYNNVGKLEVDFAIEPYSSLEEAENAE